VDWIRTSTIFHLSPAQQAWIDMNSTTSLKKCSVSSGHSSQIIASFRAGTFFVCIKEDKQNIFHGFYDPVPRVKPHRWSVPHCPTLIIRKQLPTGQRYNITLGDRPTCNRNDPAFLVFTRPNRVISSYLASILLLLPPAAGTR
jgi:hypothetical protein